VPVVSHKILLGNLNAASVLSDEWSGIFVTISPRYVQGRFMLSEAEAVVSDAVLVPISFPKVVQGKLQNSSIKINQQVLVGHKILPGQMNRSLVPENQYVLFDTPFCRGGFYLSEVEIVEDPTVLVEVGDLLTAGRMRLSQVLLTESVQHVLEADLLPGVMNQSEPYFDIARLVTPLNLPGEIMASDVMITQAILAYSQINLAGRTVSSFVQTDYEPPTEQVIFRAPIYDEVTLEAAFVTSKTMKAAVTLERAYKAPLWERGSIAAQEVPDRPPKPPKPPPEPENPWE
jgi:hypothetical protein